MNQGILLTQGDHTISQLGEVFKLKEGNEMSDECQFLNQNKVKDKPKDSGLKAS
jgi:hypothetical protein